MSTPSGPGGAPLDPDLSAVVSERRQLINLAYLLLGSLADAEDVVRQTYARWYALTLAQQEAVASPGAWLTKVATGICLDLSGPAAPRGESIAVDPADRVTLDESVSLALLVALGSMTMAERVAFILHDVYRYPITEVAEIVGDTPAACRKLASSARRRIRA